MAEERSRIFKLVVQNYFTLSVFVCIILAEIAPWFGAKDGPLRPEVTVKYVAVFIIFYTSGLTVKWRELSAAAKQVQLHVFIQLFSFLFIPMFIQIFLLITTLFFELNKWIYQGLIIVGCMPPPVSSVVILIKSMGGNEAAAIFNSALGSVLGIIFTPILLLIHVGISSTLPVVRIIVQLIGTMILPIFLGQMSQQFLPVFVTSHKAFSLMGQLSLLFIIYSSFCDMLVQNDNNMDVQVVFLTISLVGLIQVSLIAFVFKTCSLMSKNKERFSAQDIIAITFCSTHKSLTLGMPLLKTLFSGYPHLSQISLPLLIYHPVQLILGGFLVPHCRKWLKENANASRSFKKV